MEPTELKSGDLVMLKSGGPQMTYGGEALYGDALCYWFEGGDRRCEKFPYTTLCKVEPA